MEGMKKTRYGLSMLLVSAVIFSSVASASGNDIKVRLKVDKTANLHQLDLKIAELKGNIIACEVNIGHSQGISYSTSKSYSNGIGTSIGVSTSTSESYSEEISKSSSYTDSDSVSYSETTGESKGFSHSEGTSEGYSISISDSKGISLSQTSALETNVTGGSAISVSAGTSLGIGTNDDFGICADSDIFSGLITVEIPANKLYKLWQLSEVNGILK